jgi:hypothetical protein
MGFRRVAESITQRANQELLRFPSVGEVVTHMEQALAGGFAVVAVPHPAPQRL